jgi:hypothetical protein
MSPGLVEQLESLTAYRPLFPPHDAKASLNPVVFAHLRIAVGGKTCSLLSRICAAGLDYSDRANKFAHHILLDEKELPIGGPAWLLQQPGFLEDKWDGQVRMLPEGRVPPQGDSAASVCREWASCTGDAGWAGLVAESLLSSPSNPVYMIFEPGTELLRLVGEAIALLPVDRRWQVSFSTYFTGLPRGIACQWRCVPKGVPEAKAAARLPNALVLDLSAPLRQASGGALVEQARTGQRPPQPTRPQQEVSWEMGERVRRETRAHGTEWSARTEAAPTPYRVEPYPLAEPASGVASPPLSSAVPPPLKRRSSTEIAQKKSWPWVFAAGVSVGILLSLVSSAGVFYFGGWEISRAKREPHEPLAARSDRNIRSDSEDHAPEAATDRAKNDKALAPKNKDRKSADKDVEGLRGNLDPAHGTNRNEGKSKDQKGQDKTRATGEQKGKPHVGEPQAESGQAKEKNGAKAAKAGQDRESKERKVTAYADLPEWRSQPGQGPQTRVLRKDLPVDSRCKLWLYYENNKFQVGKEKGELEIETPNNGKDLIIRSKMNQQSKEVAQVSKKDNQLSFIWSDAAPLESRAAIKNALQDCVVSAKCEAAGKEFLCALREPIKRTPYLPDRHEPDKYVYSVELPDNFGRRAPLYLESATIVVKGLPKDRIVIQRIALRDMQTIEWRGSKVLFEDDQKRSILERIRVSLAPSKDRIQFEVVASPRIEPKEDKKTKQVSGAQSLRHFFSLMTLLHAPVFRPALPELNVSSLTIYTRVCGIRSDVFLIREQQE